MHVRKESRRLPVPAAMTETEAGRQTALRALTKAVRHVLQTQCEDVGPRFGGETHRVLFFWHAIAAA